MSVRVRIAPSPTGNLHIGTARTALFNWLFARHHRGQFILRIEDTDLERSRPEYTENILKGLKWLGLTWDEGPFFQSERFDLYRQATQELLDKGLAYRCYCTEAELDEMRSLQAARKEAPRYDNRHRNLTPEQQAAFEAEGRQPVIRFKIDDNRIITWHDMVRGDITWKGSDLGGDMVISRAAAGGKIGVPLYNMAVVVDDIDMKITHVIRGEDHIANTAKQILLYEAFGAKIPHFSHTPLILNQTGQKLSKRDGVTSISDFQRMGFTAPGMANYMTLLGWTPPDVQELLTLDEAAKVFTFDRVNKAGAKFDWSKLDWINSQYLHKMPTPELTDLLIPYWQAAGYHFDQENDRDWLESIATLIGPSLTRLNDVIPLTQLFFTDTVKFDDEAVLQLQDKASTTALHAVLNILETQQLSTENAEDLVRQVMKRKKLKKAAVMRALRAALSGAMHGPDMLQSWVILHQKGLDVKRFENALKAIEHDFPEETRKLKEETPIIAPEPVVVIEDTPAKTKAKSPKIGVNEPVVVKGKTSAKKGEKTPETVVVIKEETPAPIVEETPETVVVIKEETPAPIVEETPETVVVIKEETPAPIVEETPETVVVIQEETPAPIVDETPETVVVIKEETPAPIVEETPETVVVIQEETPAPIVDETPETVVVIQEETPAKIVDETPEIVVVIQEETPAKIVDETPEIVVVIQDETPAKIVDETPETVVIIQEETPAQIVDETPEIVVKENTPEPTVDKAPEKSIEKPIVEEKSTIETIAVTVIATPEIADIQPVIVSPSEKITTVKTALTSIDQQSETTLDRVMEIIEELPTYIAELYRNYQRPLITIGLILATFIIFKVVISLLDVLDDIPLLSPILKLVGLSYLGWFGYKYLLLASQREELNKQIKSWKEQIFDK